MSTAYKNVAINPSLPQAFIKRRLHSFTGLFLVLFLILHLFTNSTAALFFFDENTAFIRAANFLEYMPYLPFIELTLLALPIAIHGVWGIQYLFQMKANSRLSSGITASLPELPRNRAYTWQRITSVIVLIGIIAHVVHMRFLRHPEPVHTTHGIEYGIQIVQDPHLETLSAQLGVTLHETPSGAIVASSPSFGAVTLVALTSAFQSIWCCVLYTIFVCATLFHAMNGTWTAAITWGLSLTERSRVLVRGATNVGLIILLLFGLMSIWGVG